MASNKMDTKFSSDNNHEQDIDHLLAKHTGYLTVQELWDAAMDLKYSEKSPDDLKKDLDSMKKLDYALCQYSKSSLDATFKLNAWRIRVYDSILEAPADLYEMLFTDDQQCQLQNYGDYANLKQNPASAHLSDDDRLETIELLEDLRSQLGEIEVEAHIESEKQLYLSELDLAVCTYISEMQNKLEQIKRVTIWDDMQKEENRVRENIDVIAPVPVSVATVVESFPGEISILDF